MWLQRAWLTPRGIEVWYHTELLNLSCYVLVLWYCLKIIGDHRSRSVMRIAWILMACSAGASIGRHFFEWLTAAAGWNRTMQNSLTSLRQIPIVIAMLLLTAGLIVMWSSFTHIGLGLRFQWSDYLLAAATVIFTPWIFSLRGHLNDAGSVYPVIRALQSASPILLAAPTLVALALHRISVEMGGGQMARSLRSLVVFLFLRLAVMLVTPYTESVLVVRSMIAGFSLCAVWFFASAVCYRWQLTEEASALAERYDADPGHEIRRLAQELHPRG